MVSSVQGGKIVWCLLSRVAKMWCLLFTLAKTALCLLSYIQSVWVQERQRGTIDLIYTGRQLQEECQEQNVDLYMTSVVLNKGFNIVNCDGLWKIMSPQIHSHGAEISRWHVGRCSKGWRVLCVIFCDYRGQTGLAMALTLFSMMFSAMLKDAFQIVMLHGFTI